jgi:Zinc finger, C3HC4 type (RING finger)
MPSYVLLQCISEGSRLRVKMISSYPFPAGLNCQFPRDIREDGMYYVVDAENVKLRTNFYSVGKGCVVKQSFNLEELKSMLSSSETSVAKIYGDDENLECNVCMADNKNVVFAPCGHFSCCSGCAQQCKKCPICRGDVARIIPRADLD